MKIKSLILAFPVLCLACNNPSTPQDPASQTEASPIVAKRVSGLKMLTPDFNYDQPCNILGEEYVRQMFNLDVTTRLEERLEKNGCDFVWAGNKVAVSFGGDKPYTSVYIAEYMFDKMYQGKHQSDESEEIDPSAPKENPIQTTTSTGGTNPDAIISTDETTESNLAETVNSTTDDNQPKHSGVSSAAPPLTMPAIGLATVEAVRELGDKAVWDTSKGTLHVLYNNHIINVTVDTKAKLEVRKEHAMSLAEVLIDKIAKEEYTLVL